MKPLTGLSRRPWWLRLLLAILLSAGLVVFLLRRTSLAAIVQVLVASDWSLVALGFSVYAVANWFKALRLRLATTLDRQSVSMVDMFEATCLYNMATGLLPFGSGEISYPYLMRRWHAVRVTQSTPALLVTRLFDLIVVSFLFLLSTVLIRQELTATPQLVIAAAILFAVASLLLVLAPWFGRHMLTIFERASAHWLAGRWQVVCTRLLRAGHYFVDNVREVHNIGRSMRLGLYSVIVWLLSYWIFQLVLRGLGYDLTFWMAGFGGSLVIMTNLLPVQGVAGLGVREMGWVLGLTWMGFTWGEATMLAFSIRAVTFSYLLVLGVLAGILSLERRWMESALRR